MAIQEVKICGISVDKKKLKGIGYQKMYEMAANRAEYIWKPNKKELIDKELAKHGLRPKAVRKGKVG